MLGSFPNIHNPTTPWRIRDLEFKTAKGQSEVIFDEERNAYNSCPRAQQEEDMFGLKSKEPRVQSFEEDQPEADEIRDQPMADGITTSGTGDAIRGRAYGTTNTSGTGDAIRGRTDEASTGTDGRVSSSGHTIGDSWHAETPMVL